MKSLNPLVCVAVIRTRMDDTMALRRRQTRVLMDYEYEQTAVMTARSALKVAGMER